ncbi:MAG: response regulator [Agathobacter sp.]|mgnify:CR=1 FL=1|nr:response regulator [Agathobacter sp.]
MSQILKKIKGAMYNHNINLEARLGTLFISLGVVAAFFGIIICVLAHVPIEGKILVTVVFIGTPLITVISTKLGKPKIGRYIMVVEVILAIPSIWMTAGGILSGVNTWYVLELFFITLVLKGKALYFSLIVAGVLDLACYMVGYYYPERVYTFSDMKDAYISVIGSVIIVTIAICATAICQKKIHNNEERLLEEKQRELEKANDYQKSFLANMSHEIRSPINAVLGMNEMILRTDNLSEIKEYSKNIQDAGQALLELINDILDYSKIESGKIELVCEEYDVYSVIKNCYNMLSLRAKEKGLEFHVKNHPDIPKTLYGDELRIRQIITNLLTNALKYTDSGYMSLMLGYEWIDADNINLKIYVGDSGIGISKENIDKMFDSFQRLDITRNKSIEGTGLGLSITKSFVGLMGGTIEVKSERGKGSLFSVTIPQKVINSEPMGSFKKEVKVEKERYHEIFHAPKARILVVDDMKVNLVVVQGLLKKTLINVDTAVSGEKALELVEKNKYDVILMDHMMPEMDGIETFNRMKRTNNPNRDTPTIMLTANAVTGAYEEYINAGFKDYMSKPIKSELLEKMLKKYIPKEKIEK